MPVPRPDLKRPPLLVVKTPPGKSAARNLGTADHASCSDEERLPNNVEEKTQQKVYATAGKTRGKQNSEEEEISLFSVAK